MHHFGCCETHEESFQIEIESVISAQKGYHAHLQNYVLQSVYECQDPFSLTTNTQQSL